MCFGIPMQVRSIDGLMAECEAKGVRRQVSLFMLQHEEIAVGHYVVVHRGEAIDRINREQAEAAWEVYEAMLAAERPSTG